MSAAPSGNGEKPFPGGALLRAVWGRRRHRAARLLTNNPGSWLSLGLMAGTFLARMGVRRQGFAHGTFVLRQMSPKSGIFALRRARDCELRASICFLTGRLEASLLIGRGQYFG